MTKKEILRVIAFCLIACVMMVFLCDLFEFENTKGYDRRFYTYRTLPEQTVDAVFIGTSGADRYWCSPKAYADYGMTVYPLSTDAMPAWLYTNVLEYALTYQDVELVLVDPRAFCQSNTQQQMDVRAHRVLNAMAFGSPVWFETACKTMSTIHAAFPEQPRFNLSYLLPFIRYHAKWAEDDFGFAQNIGSRPHDYNGFFVSQTLSVRKKPQTPPAYDSTVTEALDPLSEQALYDLLDFCRERELTVLFVDTPQIPTDTEMPRMNRVYQLLEEAGADYLSFYPGADHSLALELDYNNDFYNTGHVNYYGAVKFTDVLAAYLNENYDLPDRRSDPAAQADWDGTYAYLVSQIQSFEAAAAQADTTDDEPIPDEE